MGGTSQGWATDGEQDSLCPHHTLVGRREPPMGWEHQRVWGEAIPIGVECLMARFPHHPLGPDGCLTPPLLTHMRRPWPCLDSPRLLDAEITQKKRELQEVSHATGFNPILSLCGARGRGKSHLRAQGPTPGLRGCGHRTQPQGAPEAGVEVGRAGALTPLHPLWVSGVPPEQGRGREVGAAEPGTGPEGRSGSGAPKSARSR